MSSTVKQLTNVTGFPKPAELIEVDCTTAVCVEHANHHFDCVFVEGGVVAVNEGATEFFFGKLARTVFVDLEEEGPEGVVVVAVAGWLGRGGGRALIVGDGRAVVVALWCWG